LVRCSRSRPDPATGKRAFPIEEVGSWEAARPPGVRDYTGVTELVAARFDQPEAVFWSHDLTIRDGLDELGIEVLRDEDAHLCTGLGHIVSAREKPCSALAGIRG
jgi:hypothetical protein